MRYSIFIILFSLRNIYCSQKYESKILKAVYNDHDKVFREKRDVSIVNSSNITTTEIPTTTSSEILLLNSTDKYIYYDDYTTNDAKNNIVKYYKQVFDNIFSSNKFVNNSKLSNGYNVAVPVNIKFPFLFYGNLATKITIAIGGYLYIDNFLTPYLSYTKYIAPLMGDFSTLNDPDSCILYYDTGNAFFVKWSNVYLNKYKNNGTFTFQVALFKNGTIIFIYDKISIPASTVNLFGKVGVADGYFVEVKQPSHTLIYIYRYNQISLNKTRIRAGTFTRLDPDPTCVEQLSCEDCLNVSRVPEFKCSWCPQLARCSTGIDRGTQAWQVAGCTTKNFTTLDTCIPPIEILSLGQLVVPALSLTTEMKTATTTTMKTASTTTMKTASTTTMKTTSTTTMKTASTTTSTIKTSPTPFSTTRINTLVRTTASIATAASTKISTFVNTTLVGIICSFDVSQCSPFDGSKSNDPTLAIVVICFVILIILAVFVIWIFYAYGHPNSPSGVWLIEHRPSELFRKLSKFSTSSNSPKLTFHALDSVA